MSALCGQYCQVARALGKSAFHLHRYWAGSRDVPEYMVATVELRMGNSRLHKGQDLSIGSISATATCALFV